MVYFTVVVVFPITTEHQTEIRVDSAGGYYEVSADRQSKGKDAPKKLEYAEVSLNDCLACRYVAVLHFTVVLLIDHHVTQVVVSLQRNLS